MGKILLQKEDDEKIVIISEGEESDEVLHTIKIKE